MTETLLVGGKKLTSGTFALPLNYEIKSLDEKKTKLK